jgi:hypothetical protein
MLLKITEDEQVVLNACDSLAPVAGSFGEVFSVFFALLAQEFTGFGDLLAIVEVLDGLFEAYGDAETEDDGGDVGEEVAPTMGGVMRGVDV